MTNRTKKTLFSRNETHLTFRQGYFAILPCISFNSKSGNIWNRNLHDYMDGGIWLPDRQTVRLYQYFSRQISVIPTLSITGKVELRNKKWNRILISQTPCDETELGILFPRSYLIWYLHLYKITSSLNTISLSPKKFYSAQILLFKVSYGEPCMVPSLTNISANYICFKETLLRSKGN